VTETPSGPADATAEVVYLTDLPTGAWSLYTCRMTFLHRAPAKDAPRLGYRTYYGDVVAVGAADVREWLARSLATARAGTFVEVTPAGHIDRDRYEVAVSLL
jgi:hypothetical protein